MLFAASALLAGCATSYSASHPATVLPPGRWEFGADVTGTIPVVLVADAVAAEKDVNTALTAVSKGGSIKVNLNAGIAESLAVATLVADPPLPQAEVNIRYGLPIPADVGVRINQEQLRAELYVQFLHGTWSGVAGAGYMHKWYWSGPVGLTAFTPLGALQRNDGDLTVLFGRDWRSWSFYFGPKLMYSNFSGAGLAQLASPQVMSVEIDPTLEKGHAQSLIPEVVAGFRVGTPLVKFTFEIDVVRTFYSAELLGQKDDLGVVMVVPTVGVALLP